MVTFLLSLFIVDHQQRQWRLSQHASGSDRSTAIHTIGSWLNPEPYHQDAYDHTSAEPDGSFHGWYAKKKHRAMARLEFNDAFEMRGRVLILLLTWVFLGFCAIVYATRRLFAWVF